MDISEPKKKKIYRTYYKETIKAIFEHFVMPAARCLAPGNDEHALREGLARVFHLDDRQVYFARALRAFTIPGREWLNGSPLYLGYTGKPRRLKEGEGVVVRIDAKWPDRVEVEFNEVVFVMTAESWESIEGWLEIVA